MKNLKEIIYVVLEESIKNCFVKSDKYNLTLCFNYFYV